MDNTIVRDFAAEQPDSEPQQPDNHSDELQFVLDEVTDRLARPDFLSHLSPSRLPSQAASTSSLSPSEAEGTAPLDSLHPGRRRRRARSPHHQYLNLSAIADSNDHDHFHIDNQNQIHHQLDEPEPDADEVPADLTAPLTLEPHLDLGENSVIVTTNTVEPRVSEELNSSFLEAHRAYSDMTTERGIQTFSHGHQDLVLAVDFNYFGTRMVTASSDHRLKVWDKKDNEWTLVENWRAHDAEVVDVSTTTSLINPAPSPCIRSAVHAGCATALPARISSLTQLQVKWNGPFMGEVVGSIGEDGRCKLWQEDVTELPTTGRRFKLIANLASPTNAPFMSLDFKNIMQDTWLALITRDGRLVVYEPVDQSNLHEWKIFAEHWVCGNNPPERQEEVGFKVVFHKEKLPCWTAVMAGLDRKALSLAVSSMRNVLIFRTDKSKRFYLCCELKGARQLIRDVAWANGSMRGYDVLATASKDGAIRVYELHTPRANKSSSGGESSPRVAAESTDMPVGPRPGGSGPRRNTPSGIGAGLAGASRAPESAAREHEQVPGRVHQDVKLVDELTQHHGAVWRVAFSQMGTFSSPPFP